MQIILRSASLRDILTLKKKTQTLLKQYSLLLKRRKSTKSCGESSVKTKIQCLSWPSLPQDDDHDEDVLKVQLLSLKKVFRHFSGMDIFRYVQEEDVLDEYIEIVRFASLF